MPKNQSRQADSQEANASNQREVLDAISALREELMTTMANTAKTHSDQLVELQGSLEKIECKIQDTTGRVTDLETAAAAHSDSIHAMQADMGAMKKELAFLRDRCEDLETRSRRCNLRIMGVKEGREDGNRTTQFVAELLAESLKLTSVPLLDRAHRSLRSKPSDGKAPPRAFVIKCHYFQEKESILKKAAELKSITTKNGDRITILPDYTQTVSKQRAAFGEGLSVPVAAVTLQNTTCRAEPNVTHFLLDFPVISCGTTALQEPRGVRYTNMVLLWRDKPQTNMTFKDMEKSKRPLSIQFSCLSLNSSSSPAAAADGELIPWESDPGLTGFPAPRLGSGPALLLKLFVSQNYEQTWIGPCVVTADQRVYIEISAKISRADVLQVKSCFVSPLSDPQKSPFWIVIKDGCSSDPSLTLNMKTNDEEEEEEGLEEEGSGVKIRRRIPQDKIQSLRFSFLLRPIFNNSVQFLHCSLRLCLFDLTKEEAKNEEENSSSCHGGMRIPPLTPGLQRHQCQIRNLSRPMVVTHPISSLAPRMQAHTGRRAVRPRAPPEVRPDPELNGLELQTGALMGIVFAAFAMGTCLMGALWWIFAHTGGQAACFREALLTEQTHGGGIRNLPRLSDQSSSSV